MKKSLRKKNMEANKQKAGAAVAIISWHLATVTGLEVTSILHWCSFGKDKALRVMPDHTLTADDIRQMFPAERYYNLAVIPSNPHS